MENSNLKVIQTTHLSKMHFTVVIEAYRSFSVSTYKGFLTFGNHIRDGCRSVEELIRCRYIFHKHGVTLITTEDVQSVGREVDSVTDSNISCRVNLLNLARIINIRVCKDIIETLTLEH